MFHNFLQEPIKGETFLHAEPRGTKNCPSCNKSVGPRTQKCPGEGCGHNFGLPKRSYKKQSAELQRQLDAEKVKSSELQSQLDAEKAKSSELQRQLDELKQSRPRSNSLVSIDDFGGAAANPTPSGFEIDGVFDNDLTYALDLSPEQRVGQLVLSFGKKTEEELIHILGQIEGLGH